MAVCYNYFWITLSVFGVGSPVPCRHGACSSPRRRSKVPCGRSVDVAVAEWRQFARLSTTRHVPQFFRHSTHGYFRFRESTSASPGQILSKSGKLFCTYGDLPVFKMVAVCHFAFVGGVFGPPILYCLLCCHRPLKTRTDGIHARVRELGSIDFSTPQPVLYSITLVWNNIWVWNLMELLGNEFYTKCK